MNDENATSSASPANENSTDSTSAVASERKGTVGPLAARLMRKQPVEPATEPIPAGPQPMVSAEQWVQTEVSSGFAKKEQPKPKSPHQESRSKGNHRKDRDKDNDDDDPRAVEAPRPPRVSVPLRRGPLDDDLQRDLDAALGEANMDQLLSGPVRGAGELSEGARVRGTVIKVHQDFVFVSLGGPHEGMVSLLQFESPPEPGSVLDVVVRRFSADDGLYLLVVPGQTIQADDWSDLQDGSIVDCTVTGVNSGGLEVKVGNLPGFMPAGQVAEHRVEDLQGYVDQRLTCIVTEASERRGRLIVSRRAVLERERQDRRQAQLEQIQPGDILEGTVRSIKNFGAFVDLGGLEGLLHISKLSWDKIEHPNEVLQEGQKVRVKIDKIEKHSGKISLSYRDLLENPWDSIEREHPIGSTVRGKVTRIANYGAFVKITTGIEGLIHVSELAHHRVFKVENVVKEGDEVEVKVLSIDREAQKVGLSLKATQAKPEPKTDSGHTKAEVDEPPRQPVIKRQHEGPLRGGTDRSGGAGESFGLKW